ncbi:MAG: WD40 repeat domain-containing protein [Halobacteriota archaeon]
MNPFGKLIGKYRSEFDEDHIIYELSEKPLIHTNGCRALSTSISPSPLSCLVAGSSDGNIYYLNEDGLDWTYQTGGYVWGISVSSDGKLVAAGSSNGNTYLLNRQGELLWDCSVGSVVYNISMSSDGHYIAVSADEHGIYLFNNEGEFLWNEQIDAVRGVSLSADGTYLAFSQAIKGWEDKIGLYKTRNSRNEPKKEWRYKVEDYMWGAAVSPDGSYIAAGSSDGNIYFFDRKGKLLWTYRTGGYVWGVSISCDGKLVAAGSSDGHIYLLNIKGDLLWSYKTSGDVMDVSLSADGAYMAATSLDMNVYHIVIP